MSGTPPPSNSTDLENQEASPPSHANPAMLPNITTNQPDAGAGPFPPLNQASERHTRLETNWVPQRDAPSPSTTALLKRINTLEVTIGKQEEKLLKQRHLIRQKEEMITHLLGGAQPFDPDQCYYCGRGGGTELIVQRPPLREPDTSKEERREAGRTYFYTGGDADHGASGNTDPAADVINDGRDVEVDEEEEADDGHSKLEKQENQVGEEQEIDRDRDEEWVSMDDWASEGGTGSTQRPESGW